MKKLSCHSCGSTLNTDTLSSKYAVIHCSHCGSAYDASNLDRRDRLHPLTERIDLSYAKPERIKVSNRPNETAYSWRAYRPVTSVITIAINSAVIFGLPNTYLREYLTDFPIIDEYFFWFFVPIVGWTAGAAFLIATELG